MTPYEEGREDFFRFIGVDENPYEADSAEAVEWANGWLAAEEEYNNDE